MRPSWIDIDLNAIEHNVREILIGIGGVDLCAVVKADAYGHGDIPVAKAALRGGATSLAVALVEEGVKLRDAGIDTPILVLSEPHVDEIQEVITHELTPTVYSAGFVEEIGGAATQSSTTPYPVHLKIDTGMHRVGAPPIEAFQVARLISSDERLILEGVWTHFSVADSDLEYTLRQNRALIRFVEALDAEGIRPKVVHAANTAAAFALPETRHDMCRVGLGIYGMRPTPESGPSIGLVPVMRVVSAVSSTRDLSRGARPSYGRRRSLPEAGRVVTVPIGYADGVSRGLSETGNVLIRGRRYPYAGTITMDMVVVDVGRDEIEVGEEVVLMGTQEGEMISPEEWAGLLDTITYEVVCSFGPRLVRRHMNAREGGAASDE